MKCRLTYILAAATLAVLASCATAERPETPATYREDEKVNVRFGFGTRTIDLLYDEAPEMWIDEIFTSLDVIAFDASTGLAYSGGRSEVGTEVSMNVRKGMRLKYYVLLNAPEGVLSECRTVTAFRAALSRLADSFTGGLVSVSAEQEGVFESDAEVTVPVTRICSRVRLGVVVPALMDSEEFSGSSVVLKGVELINLVGTCPYSLAPEAGDLWYRKMGGAGLPEGAAEYTGKDLSFGLETSEGVNVHLTFYCLPNPTDNDVTYETHPLWCPRNTRLVLSMLIDNNECYYPIDIPAMKCGHSYDINTVTITRRGSHHPDIPVSDDTAEFTVEVTPWGINDINKILQ